MSLVEAPDMPWLMPEVVRWLQSWITADDTDADNSILETGMGGSTLFFAHRVRHVISYEHDAKWYDTIMRRLEADRLSNVEARYRRDYPAAGLGPLPPIDLALIDGRGRVRSVLDAMPAIKSGGWLVLDDSNRERYQEAHRALESWQEQIIWRCGEDCTQAWRKP